MDMSTSSTDMSANRGSRHVSMSRRAARDRPLSVWPIAVPGGGSIMAGKSCVPRRHGKTMPSTSTTRSVTPRRPRTFIFAIGTRSSAYISTLSGSFRVIVTVRRVGIRASRSRRLSSKSIVARFTPLRRPRFSAMTSALTILPEEIDTCEAMSVMTHCSRYISRSLPKPKAPATSSSATTITAATTRGPRRPPDCSILLSLILS